MSLKDAINDAAGLQDRAVEGVAEHLMRQAEAVDRELRLARHAKQRLMPNTLPEVPGLRTGVLDRPAHYVGGDGVMGAVMPDGRMLTVLFDAPGHGLAAAFSGLLMQKLIGDQLHTLLRKRQAAGEPTTQTAALLNELMVGINAAAMRPRVSPLGYPTAVAAVVEPSTGRATLLCAGHPPPLLLRRDGTLERPDTTGRMLGLLDSWQGDAAEACLGPGDRLLLVTDGVEEALSGDWASRLAAACAASGCDPGERAAAALLDAEAGSLERVDDVTVVRLERPPST